MMKYVVLLALSLFTSLSGWAFSLDNADIRLLCPQRGQIEVILHRYEHTQQSWGQHHFETYTLSLHDALPIYAAFSSASDKAA